MPNKGWASLPGPDIVTVCLRFTKGWELNQTPAPEISAKPTNWNGTPVMPVRRGVLVTPVESEWIIQRGAADLQEADPTSGSLRRRNGRGTLVVPAELAWIIKRCAADMTSTSLRGTDPTSGSLREAKWEANRLGYPFLITMNRSNHRQAGDPPDSRQLPGPGQRRSMAFRIERGNDPVPESSP